MTELIRLDSLPQVLGTDPNEKAMKTLGTLPPGGLDLEELLGSIEKSCSNKPSAGQAGIERRQPNCSRLVFALFGIS